MPKQKDYHSDLSIRLQGISSVAFLPGNFFLCLPFSYLWLTLIARFRSSSNENKRRTEWSNVIDIKQFLTVVTLPFLNKRAQVHLVGKS